MGNGRAGQGLQGSHRTACYLRAWRGRLSPALRYGALLENTQIRGPGRAGVGLNRVSFGSGDNLGGARLPSIRDALRVFFSQTQH